MENAVCVRVSVYSVALYRLVCAFAFVKYLRGLCVLAVEQIIMSTHCTCVHATERRVSSVFIHCEQRFMRPICALVFPLARVCTISMSSGPIPHSKDPHIHSIVGAYCIYLRHG